MLQILHNKNLIWRSLGVWCNGNMPVSKTVLEGSSPSTPANIFGSNTGFEPFFIVKIREQQSSVFWASTLIFFENISRRVVFWFRHFCPKWASISHAVASVSNDSVCYIIILASLDFVNSINFACREQFCENTFNSRRYFLSKYNSAFLWLLYIKIWPI